MNLFCIHCNNSDISKYHTEEIKTLDYPPTWEIWFCCHICRDQNKPCETFYKTPD